MDNLQKYKPTDKMIDLISDNYSLLQVMSRFGLSLGFGDKTVKEVCELNGVDCRTFLIVVNFMAEGFSRLDGDKDDISIPALIDYLRQAHIYFLDFSLPAIRRKLIEAIDCSQDDVAFLILKFFDEYTREVRKHMDYEEKTVFKYVDALIAGNAPKNYQISTFSKHHDQVGEKLTELKNIIIKYCPAKANENLLNAALFDIYACDEALAAPDLESSYELWKKAQWDGETGVSAEGDLPWIWLVNVDHLYWVRDGLHVAEQKVHPHGHGWSIVNNVDRWYYE